MCAGQLLCGTLQGTWTGDSGHGASVAAVCSLRNSASFRLFLGRSSLLPRLRFVIESALHASPPGELAATGSAGVTESIRLNCEPCKGPEDGASGALPARRLAGRLFRRSAGARASIALA